MALLSQQPPRPHHEVKPASTPSLPRPPKAKAVRASFPLCMATCISREKLSRDHARGGVGRATFALLATAAASVCCIQQSFFFFVLPARGDLSISPPIFCSRMHDRGFVLLPPTLPQGDRWGFGEASMSGTPTSHTYNAAGSSASGEEIERPVQWNNSMLSHRRCNSAPNISSSWRSASLPSLPSGVLAPDLRDHTIPEGRRFEASF